MRYKKGYKYQLWEDETILIRITGYTIDTQFIKLNAKGVLLIRKGYAWDGPSGPTFDTKTFMLGALVHDALYQLIRNAFLPVQLRKMADDILREICLREGMCRFRAWYVHKSVRKLGNGAATKPKKIYYIKTKVLSFSIKD